MAGFATSVCCARPGGRCILGGAGLAGRVWERGRGGGGRPKGSSERLLGAAGQVWDWGCD